MKKIAQIIPYFYPAMAFGGPAKLVYEYSKELSKYKQITILTSDTFNFERRISNKEKLRNINTIYFKNIINKLAYTHRFFTHFGLTIYILFNVRKYDLYHIHDIFIIPQLLSCLILKSYSIPYIVSPHGVLDPIRIQKKSIAKKILLFLVKYICSNAQIIIATSTKEMNDLDLLGFKNVKVIFNGVGNIKAKINRKYRIYENGNIITLLYIGKLHPQKGLFEFISALKRSERSDIQLLIAGQDDGDEIRLKSLVKKMNLTDKVKFLGFVNESNKKSLYKISDLFIHPSFSEGFSISILEALNEGLPVFITKQCNFPDVKKFNAGIVVSNSNILKLTSKLKLLSKKQINACKPNTKKLINAKYSIKIMSRQLLEIYEKYI